MPKLLAPHKSGVHRAACFALFRALLRQKRHILGSVLDTEGYKARIRHVFNRNKDFHGHARLTQALQLGYKALEVLRDSKVCDSALKYLVSLPPQQNRHLGRSSQRQAPKAEPSPQVHKEPAGPLLYRPHRLISGRRRAPKLVNACRFPFLRIKKPQPPFLSRLIKASTLLREKRLADAVKYQKEIKLAEDEDQWDRLLVPQLKVYDGVNELSWAQELRHALQENQILQAKAVRKRVKMAKIMTDIVEKEKVCVLREKQARQRKRMQEREKQLREKEEDEATQNEKEEREKNHAYGEVVKTLDDGRVVTRPDKATVLIERLRRKEERAICGEGREQRRMEKAWIHQRPGTESASYSDSDIPKGFHAEAGTVDADQDGAAVIGWMTGHEKQQAGPAEPKEGTPRVRRKKQQMHRLRHLKRGKTLSGLHWA